MDQSTAAEALLEVAARSSARRTRSASRTRESTLSEPPPSPAPTVEFYSSRRHVHFEDSVEASSSAPAAIPARSTHGKAPVRLIDQQELVKPNSYQIPSKRRQSAQPLQPPSKKLSTGRKALSDAANTTGEKRDIKNLKEDQDTGPCDQNPTHEAFLSSSLEWSSINHPFK